MAEPLRIFRSLDEITTRYTVFEEDQVLTHRQLNDLAGYLDDQDRLTRVGLLGVGIACGLRVSLRASPRDNLVVVTSGVGVTTDGDLLRLGAEERFDRFKPYDRTAPAYPPFYAGQDVAREMLPVFELVREGEADGRAAPLGDLAATQTGGLDAMAAVLFMESYVKDDDLCTGTDCDNLGQGSIHTRKLLLLRRSDAAALLERISTLDQAGRNLPEVVADRPLLPANLATEAALTAVYRTACGNLHDQIVRAFRDGSGVFGELTGGDPTGSWTAALAALRTRFAGTGFGIQYYYDFLKDLAETWNALRERLLDDTTVCCPDLSAFPKHLVLGGLQVDGAELRTGFYPSPLASRTAGHRGHARFLATKLGALIELFEPPVTGRAIRVTPSGCEDRSLEERAIPYYYRVPVHRSWSYALERRGASARNYSYNAALFGAEGAARDPLRAQIGRFDFFRIEGHLGQKITDVTGFLETEIRDKHLPFQVRAVAVSGNRTAVVVKPPIRYTELHDVHQLLRWDLSTQLEQVKTFGQVFQDRVARDVVPAEDNGATLLNSARTQNSTIQTNASAAANKLNVAYSAYTRDPSWRSDMGNTVVATGRFKSELKDVAKTNFVTPFDTLISGPQATWLGWLDTLIQSKDQREDDKLLLTNFRRRHPGLEHFAGVVRGGTFVLVYDASQNVVADFMLPYVCCDAVETEEPAQPPRPTPAVVHPDFVLNDGISLHLSQDKLLNTRFTGFQGTVNQAIEGKIDDQSRFFSVFRDSVNTIGTVFTGLNTGRKVNPGLADSLLDFQARDLSSRADRITELRQLLLNPELDPKSRTFVEEQLRGEEVGLVQSAGVTTQLLADRQVDVKPGSDGFRVMAAVSDAVDRVSHKDAVAAAGRVFSAINTNTRTPQAIKVMVGSVLKNKGL